MTDWTKEAREDAADFIENFEEEVLEKILAGDPVPSDPNNEYPNGDSYFHESYVDKWYSLTRAAEIIDELSDYEETDSGLWEGQDPREAISTMAAFTYGNAVYHFINDLVSEINEAIDNWHIDNDPIDDSAEMTEEDAAKILKQALAAWKGD